MDTECTLPRSAHTHSQHVEVDETACGFDGSIYLDLARKAILAAYKANGWEGSLEEDGDIQVWSEHGNAWFTDIRYEESESCHKIFLDQQWHRPDESIPVFDEGDHFYFKKREPKPKAPIFSENEGPTRGLDQFYNWMLECMNCYPNAFGPDHFQSDFDDDPFFEIPNFADDEDDGERAEYDYEDEDDYEDEGPSAIDPYWTLPPGTLEKRAAGRTEDDDE